MALLLIDGWLGPSAAAWGETCNYPNWTYRKGMTQLGQLSIKLALLDGLYVLGGGPTPRTLAIQLNKGVITPSLLLLSPIPFIGTELQYQAQLSLWTSCCVCINNKGDESECHDH